MKLSANHLKRYREIAGLLWKYGRSDLAKQMGAEEMEGKNLTHAIQPTIQPGQPPPTNGAATPEHFVDDLEAMGPTYVKVGQVLAGRPDLMPETYRTALVRLQDRVKPFPSTQVQKIIESELGVRMSKAFSRFDAEPIAAASLGQVHYAALRDGRPVVVKIQRPDISRTITEDFEVLDQIAGTLDGHTKMGRRYRFSKILEEFRLTIQNELNYEREAQNLIAMGRNLASFEKIQVPQPILNYSTRTVLTMEFITGRKITSLTPLARIDIKGAPLCEELFRAYLKQVLVDGLFHADPHPGNVFLTDEGRIALLDLGMVGHTAPRMQEQLLKLLLAVSDGNSDAAANVLVEMGEKTEAFNLPEFRRQIRQVVIQQSDQGLAQLKIGSVILALCRDAGENGLFVPSELTLLGKTLLQLDEIGRILAPEFDPNAAVRRNVDELMMQRMRKDVTKGNALSTILETKEFLGGLPARLNRMMDAAANGEIEVKIKSVDAKVVMEGTQKIANRITTGLVLAALIIGASIMMRIPTDFQLFGYPGLAILCFIAAAGGGFWLVVNIFVQDYRSRRSIKT